MANTLFILPIGPPASLPAASFRQNDVPTSHRFRPSGPWTGNPEEPVPHAPFFRLPQLFCAFAIASFLLLLPRSAQAQDPPQDFEAGLKSYGSFYGGDIDSVSTSEGSLSVQDPPNHVSPLLATLRKIAVYTNNSHCGTQGASFPPRFELLSKEGVMNLPLRLDERGRPARPWFRACRASPACAGFRRFSGPGPGGPTG
jgi:hypothetical protein